MTWPWVGALGVLGFCAVAFMWMVLDNYRDEREHADRLREMQDEIDGIIR